MAGYGWIATDFDQQTIYGVGKSERAANADAARRAGYSGSIYHTIPATWRLVMAVEDRWPTQVRWHLQPNGVGIIADLEEP